MTATIETRAMKMMIKMGATEDEDPPASLPERSIPNLLDLAAAGSERAPDPCSGDDYTLIHPRGFADLGTDE
jgi:hypothetical protein